MKVWRKEPAWLVLPLIVEPSKSRLCVNARFLNLWMADTYFSLNKLAEVPCFVYVKSFMTKLADDKAGYDDVLLTEEARAYFGFQWDSWWFVNATLPFGWKNSPFIYQSIGLVGRRETRHPPFASVERRISILAFLGFLVRSYSLENGRT